MQETVIKYTKIFQDFQETLESQEEELKNLIRKLGSHIELLDFEIEESKQYFRPNNLQVIILTKMRTALYTYKSRCDIIYKQVVSSKVDIDETLTTNEWVANAIATKERLNENT
jgi:hypothetical protein